MTDVTLVCEDGKQVEAHKVVLVASSPFFLNILSKNKHTHPLIYMRGLKHEDLVSIMDFLYKGEANIFQGRINQFMIIAKESELKEVSKECLDEEDESDSFEIVDQLISKYIRKDEEEVHDKNIGEQAGAELCQAQVKLGLATK